jgi:hypothetical protein
MREILPFHEFADPRLWNVEQLLELAESQARVSQ